MLNSEAVAKRCSVKKVFLEISEKSQEDTCARATCLIKLQGWALQLYEKRGSGTGAFLWILRNFWEHLFLKNTSDGCFWQNIDKTKSIGSYVCKSSYMYMNLRFMHTVCVKCILLSARNHLYDMKHLKALKILKKLRYFYLCNVRWQQKPCLPL